jgi:hypothetical protein
VLLNIQAVNLTTLQETIAVDYVGSCGSRTRPPKFMTSNFQPKWLGGYVIGALERLGCKSLYNILEG